MVEVEIADAIRDGGAGGLGGFTLPPPPPPLFARTTFGFQTFLGDDSPRTPYKKVLQVLCRYLESFLTFLVLGFLNKSRVPAFYPLVKNIEKRGRKQR